MPGQARTRHSSSIKQVQQRGAAAPGYRVPPQRTVAFARLVVDEHPHAGDAAKPAAQQVW